MEPRAEWEIDPRGVLDILVVAPLALGYSARRIGAPTTMIIEIQFTDRPISLPPCVAEPGTGAVLEFQGVVRDRENGGKISALVYELYAPMAEKVMRQILQDLAVLHPCLYAGVIHRYGVVPAGEMAIYVRVESAHRGAGLRVMEEFMNRLKSDVPIWKTGSLPS